MQLEVNVRRLDAETTSGGRKFVKSLTRDTAERETKRAVATKAAQVVDEVLKSSKKK
jgi:hypothetical protein